MSEFRGESEFNETDESKTLASMSGQDPQNPNGSYINANRGLKRIHVVLALSLNKMSQCGGISTPEAPKKPCFLPVTLDHPFDSLHSEVSSPLNIATDETKDPFATPQKLQHLTLGQSLGAPQGNDYISELIYGMGIVLADQREDRQLNRNRTACQCAKGCVRIKRGRFLLRGVLGSPLQSFIGNISLTGSRFQKIMPYITLFVCRSHERVLNCTGPFQGAY